LRCQPISEKLLHHRCGVTVVSSRRKPLVLEAGGL
jgi:hypothetical protein